MIESLFCIVRSIVIRIVNCGRVSLPLHSRLGEHTNVYTSRGRIRFGYGVITAPNTNFSALDGGSMHIGNRVFVNRNCIFVCRKSIRIGNHCTFGPNVCIYDHDHKYGYQGIESGYNYGDICIEDHCWIGAGVIILKNTQIGEGSIIGAGCVVKGTVPPHSLVTMDSKLKIREINK